MSPGGAGERGQQGLGEQVGGAEVDPGLGVEVGDRRRRDRAGGQQPRGMHEEVEAADAERRGEAEEGGVVGEVDRVPGEAGGGGGGAGQGVDRGALGGERRGDGGADAAGGAGDEGGAAGEPHAGARRSWAARASAASARARTASPRARRCRAAVLAVGLVEHPQQRQSRELGRPRRRRARVESAPAELRLALGARLTVAAVALEHLEDRPRQAAQESASASAADRNPGCRRRCGTPGTGRRGCA